MLIRGMCLVALCVVATLAGCERPHAVAPTEQAGASPEPSADVFVSGSEQQIVKALQEGTDFSGQPDLDWFTVLLNIWYERSDAHPAFAWDVLKVPRVKVVVGSQLAQAYRNKLIPLNIEDIRQFALANYSSEESTTSRSSLILLGTAGNPADIALLEQVARSGVAGRRMFKEAATALFNICGDEADRALRGLMVDADEDDRMFVESWLKNREHMTAAWCR